MNFFKVLAVAAISLVSVQALGSKTYQATGAVLAVTDTSITIQKTNEKWEIEKSAATKITGEVKVGSKVTIEYTMTATTVTAKPEKSAKK